MRILFANYSEITSPGGVHKTIREIAKNLSKIGHEVIVLQANPLNLPKEEINEGFRIIRVKSAIDKYLYGFSPEIYFYLKEHLNALKPDIIHIHGYHTLFSPEVIYLIKRINPNIPIVFSPHFGNLSHDTIAGKYLWGIYNKLIGKRIMKYPFRIIAASNYEANNINNILGVPKDKIEVIPHGVDIIDFNKTEHKSHQINLLYMGYLLELKGVQYIIKTVYELIYKKGAKVQLTIVGKGPYEDKLKRLATKLNVNQFINWKGFIFSRKEFIKEIKKADILLLLSKSENYGIVVAEALALGTPVVVTKRTALVEFLNEPGCFGVNYPPNPKEVAKLILEIMNSDVKVGPFSKKIRTWDEVAKDYEKVYIEILNKQ